MKTLNLPEKIDQLYRLQITKEGGTWRVAYVYTPDPSYSRHECWSEELYEALDEMQYWINENYPDECNDN